MGSLREYCVGLWPAGLGEGHGLPHWQRVAAYGRLLCGLNRADWRVVESFAYLHDVCRADNFGDPGHGARAASLARSLRTSFLSSLDEVQFSLLLRACTLHNIEERTGYVTIDTCFDADRMDLPRAGVIPDPLRMATASGASLVRSREYLESWRLPVAGAPSFGPLPSPLPATPTESFLH